MKSYDETIASKNENALPLRTPISRQGSADWIRSDATNFGLRKQPLPPDGIVEEVVQRISLPIIDALSEAGFSGTIGIEVDVRKIGMQPQKYSFNNVF